MRAAYTEAGEKGYARTMARPMTPEDLWAIRRVGVPAPAPDGTFAVVGVTTYVVAEDKGIEVLWRVTPDGAATPLTAPDVSSSQPAVSPDGRRLAFVRAGSAPGKDGKRSRPQLHVLPLDGPGEARRFGDFPLGASDPRWLPDGRRLVVVASVYRDAPALEDTRQRLGQREATKTPSPRVTEDRVYRYWDRWLTDGEVPHLFVVDTESGEVRDLTPGSTRWFDLMDPGGQYDVAPDGVEIAFSANATEPPYDRLRMAIFTVPVAGGEVLCLTPDHPADDVRPRYSLDGRWLVYGTKRDPDNYADRVRLARLDRRSGAHEVLTEGWDRSASEWELASDGSLIVTAEDSARVGVFRLDVAAPAGGAPAQLAREGTVQPGRGLGGGVVWLVHSTLRRPPEIARLPLAGGAIARVSGFNDELLAGVTMADVEELEIAGADGAPVHIAVLYPPGFDRSRRWPLVHLIHGGPYGVSGDGWHFRWCAQVMAAPGYVVACVNFHGSSSFGQAFANSILGDWGGHAAEDILRASDHLVEKGFVDPARMAITGGSFGGYMACWLASQTDRFRCAIAHACVFDLAGSMAADVTQGIEKELGGEPWGGAPERRGPVDRHDPSRFGDRIRTPMLVLHGERDYRCTVEQGLELYGVLKARGVPARLVVYPEENHWILKPSSSLHWYGEFLGWLRRWLDGDRGSA